MRAKGLPKTGGRKKGTRNRATIARQKAIEDSGLSSLGYLQSVYRDDIAPQQARIECAKAAAPFEFPRLAAIEHTGQDGAPIKIESLTDAQLDFLIERLARVDGVAGYFPFDRRASAFVQSETAALRQKRTFSFAGPMSEMGQKADITPTM